MVQWRGSKRGPRRRRAAGPTAVANAVRALTALFLLWSPAVGCSLATNLDSLSSSPDWPDAAVLDSQGADRHGVDVGSHPVSPVGDGAVSAGERDAAGIDAAGTDAAGTDDGAPTADVPVGDDGAASERPGPDGEVVADAPPAVDVLGGPDLAIGDGKGDAGWGDGAVDAVPTTCPLSPTRSATLQLINANAGATTACGFARADLPPFIAAVDSATFAASAACGACLRIETPAAVVVATLVDLGPAKTAANATTVAVNRAALSLLAPDGSTYIDQGVEWRFVPCPIPATSGMTFLFQAGSNASYAALLIQNHRSRIDTVEYRISGVYHRLTRSTYNYWVAQNGMGGGPFTLRITDVYGNAVEQAGVPLMPGVLFRGQAQFPFCSEAAID